MAAFTFRAPAGLRVWFVCHACHACFDCNVEQLEMMLDVGEDATPIGFYCVDCAENEERMWGTQ